MIHFPSMPELMVIFCIVLVLFGGGKLAGVGKSLGTAISEFKEALNSEKKEGAPVGTIDSDKTEAS